MGGPMSNINRLRSHRTTQLVASGLLSALVGFTLQITKLSALDSSGREFGQGTYAGKVGFLAVFGVSKALANLSVGWLVTRLGYVRTELAGWLLGLAMPLLLLTAAQPGPGGWRAVMGANVVLGLQQGLCWSVTVLVMILVMPSTRRGLASGLNETLGYAAVAAAAPIYGALEVKMVTCGWSLPLQQLSAACVQAEAAAVPPASAATLTVVGSNLPTLPPPPNALAAANTTAPSLLPSEPPAPPAALAVLDAQACTSPDTWDPACLGECQCDGYGQLLVGALAVLLPAGLLVSALLLVEPPAAARAAYGSTNGSAYSANGSGGSDTEAGFGAGDEAGAVDSKRRAAKLRSDANGGDGGEVRGLLEGEPAARIPAPEASVNGHGGENVTYSGGAGGGSWLRRLAASLGNAARGAAVGGGGSNRRLAQSQYYVEMAQPETQGLLTQPPEQDQQPTALPLSTQAGVRPQHVTQTPKHPDSIGLYSTGVPAGVPPTAHPGQQKAVPMHAMHPENRWLWHDVAGGDVAKAAGIQRSWQAGEGPGASLHPAPLEPWAHSVRRFSRAFVYFTWHNPSTAAMCLAGVVSNTLTSLAWGLILTWARDALGVPGPARNLLTASYSFLKGLVQLLSGAVSDSAGRRGPVVVGLLLNVAGLATSACGAGWGGALLGSTVLPAQRPMVQFGYLLLGACLMGAGSGVFYPVMPAAVVDHHGGAEGHSLAAGMATYRFWRDLGYAAGALGGPLADVAGVEGTLLVAAGVCLLVAGMVAARYEERPPVSGGSGGGRG